MNMWLYLPEQFYDGSITKILGNSMNEVFSGLEDEISTIPGVGNVAEMPSEMLYEWLKLNDISATGSEELDRQLFKRYYSLMRRRGTLGAISRVIETGGAVYSVDMSKFNYKVFRGIDKMMKYCRRYTNYFTFNPDMYCPGVFFIETTNINAVDENPLLDKVFPAGCKYYVVRVLLPKTIAMNISNIDFLRETDSHYFCQLLTSVKDTSTNKELNSYFTQVGDIYKSTWDYLDFISYEKLNGESMFYLSGANIVISKDFDEVYHCNIVKDSDRSVELNSSKLSINNSVKDYVRSVVLEKEPISSPDDIEYLRTTDVISSKDLSTTVKVYSRFIESSYRASCSVVNSSTRETTKGSYDVEWTDTYKSGYYMEDVVSMEYLRSLSKGVKVLPVDIRKSS